MSTGSRGNLAVHEYRKAEGARQEALTQEGQIQDERLDELESEVAELKARVETLWGAVQRLLREL